MCCVSLVNKDINLMITKPIYIQTLSPEYTKEKQSEELLAEFMLRMVVVVVVLDYQQVWVCNS